MWQTCRHHSIDIHVKKIKKAITKQNTFSTNDGMTTFVFSFERMSPEEVKHLPIKQIEIFIICS